MNDEPRPTPDARPAGHVSWESLNDLADRRLSPSEEQAAQLHLAVCTECQAQLDALRSLATDARALPHEVAPPDDLWKEVTASIGQLQQAETPALPPRLQASDQQSATPQSSPRTPRSPRSNALPQPTRLGKTWLAAAAVVLMALSSALTALYMRSAETRPRTVASDTAPQETRAATTLLPAAFVETERTYLASVAEVEALLDAQRNVLAPATIETVDRALATIDAAIAEARTALLADPANRALAELLETSYRQKLDLLRRTAGLHQTS